MYQKCDEYSETENVGFEVLNTKSDFLKARSPGIGRAEWLAEQEGTINLSSYLTCEWCIFANQGF